MSDIEQLLDSLTWPVEMQVSLMPRIKLLHRSGDISLYDCEPFVEFNAAVWRPEYDPARNVFKVNLAYDEDFDIMPQEVTISMHSPKHEIIIRGYMDLAILQGTRNMSIHINDDMNFSVLKQDWRPVETVPEDNYL